MHSCCTPLRNAGFLEIQLSILHIIKKLDDKWIDLDLDAITKYSIRNHNFVHFWFYFTALISVYNVHKEIQLKRMPSIYTVFCQIKIAVFQIVCSDL